MKPELPVYARVLAGALFGGGGLYLLALGFGILSPGPGEAIAPLWLVILSGVFFCFAPSSWALAYS